LIVHYTLVSINPNRSTLWKKHRKDSIKSCIFSCDFHHENERHKNLHYICNNAILTAYSKLNIFV
jgi:hypothetical protein